jgi:hypothetical protein
MERYFRPQTTHLDEKFVKEFICLSCWETFEIAISDVRGKDSVDCTHCGAAQEILDDVIEVNQGNLDDTPTETAVDETKESGSISDEVVDELISASGLEEHDESVALAVEHADETPSKETNEPGIEIEITPFETSESIGPESLGVDPLEQEPVDDIDAEDPGVDLLMDTEIEETASLIESLGLDADVESILEEAEEALESGTTDNTVTEAKNDADEPEKEHSSQTDEPEIGSEYSEENKAENNALSRSVQELVDSITDHDLKLPKKSDSEGLAEDQNEEDIAGADTLNDLRLEEGLFDDEKVIEDGEGLTEHQNEEDIAGADTLNGFRLEEGLFDDEKVIESTELAAQFDDAGGLGFELEGLEDVLLSTQPDDEVTEESLEPIPSLEEEESERPEEPQPMDFELVTADQEISEEKSLADGIDEDELADAVSELFEESSSDNESGSETNEKDSKIKSWRVRLKSGLVLSFPSLIVVQGWAADKDTSTISLARGDGEFKPYEQVLGMIQTIEIKALDPGKSDVQEEEEELVDGLSAAARAAAKRRRDGKMENITAEYQFRKDVYNHKKSSSKKGPLLALSLIVLLAGSAVAVEFLGIADLGLGFAPAPPKAERLDPPPSPVNTKKTGPNFNLSKTAAPKGATGKVSKTPKTPSPTLKENPAKTTAVPTEKATSKTVGKKKKKKKKKKGKKKKKR